MGEFVSLSEEFAGNVSQFGQCSGTVPATPENCKPMWTVQRECARTGGDFDFHIPYL
jgi:hypothetical protein